MKMKSWFFFLLAASSPLFGGVDAEGWASVDPPKKSPFEEGVEETALWVIFSKQMGSENFLLSFPNDPSYFSLPEGGMECSASEKGWMYRLVVEKEGPLSLETRRKEVESKPGVLLLQAKRSSLGCLDLLYREEGRWVRERLYQGKEHVYLLQTIGESPSREHHDRFRSSFSLSQGR